MSMSTDNAKRRKSASERLSQKKPSKTKSSSQLADIRSNLDHLRTVTKEVSRSLTTNIERDILEVTDLVNELASQGNPPKGSAIDLEEIAEILNRLSLKPEKGRRGDLKKIEKALQLMRKSLSKKKD